MPSIKKDIQTQVFNLISDVVESKNIELLEVQYLKEKDRWYLRIIIDKRGGININDCEIVSRAVEPVIDNEIDIPHAYYLEVQSPGLDRPLKTESDFRRYKDNLVELSFYKAQSGQKTVIGILVDNDNDGLTIEVDGKNTKYLFSDIAKIKRTINF